MLDHFLYDSNQCHFLPLGMRISRIVEGLVYFRRCAVGFHFLLLLLSNLSAPILFLGNPFGFCWFDGMALWY
jgi:hypothetical protein